jgi:hypothetical protein
MELTRIKKATSSQNKSINNCLTFLFSDIFVTKNIVCKLNINYHAY